MPTVGERLRTLRESVKLSQAKLGELAELKQATVNRYEHSNAEAPYSVLLWYADYFDVSLDYIFGRCEQPQGKLYDYQPKVFNEDMKQFVEMCFDPNSPMSDKLKQVVLRLMQEEQRK
ncbi:MAG: helix-turn-helix domain-containing protein [Oscillospiraceae bacterium]|jgi:transcriptional regulator with XRE-family HTH domain|nr:helix-turn-helix domain-containing protein [Oscillospiraceae bacterium]